MINFKKMCIFAKIFVECKKRIFPVTNTIENR